MGGVAYQKEIGLGCNLAAWPVRGEGAPLHSGDLWLFTENGGWVFSFLFSVQGSVIGGSKTGTVF